MRGQFAICADRGRPDFRAASLGRAAGRIVTFVIARVAAVAVGALLAPFLLQAARADDTPKHGGTLEFASTVEPGNYDCHGNTSFAFLHPVAPHYSTLLKFDAANYPQIVGDLAQSWTVLPDRQTYTFKLRPNVLFDLGRCQGELPAQCSPAGQGDLIAAGRFRRNRRDRHTGSVNPCLSPAMAGRGDAG